MQVANCISDDEFRLFAQGETTPAIAKQKAEGIEGIEGARPVYSTTFYIGLEIKAKQRMWIGECWGQTYCSWFHSFWMKPDQLVPEDLIYLGQTAEFIKMVKSWDKFDEVKMGAVVRHIKR